jgi:hypothetical protein
VPLGLMFDSLMKFCVDMAVGDFHPRTLFSVGSPREGSLAWRQIQDNAAGIHMQPVMWIEPLRCNELTVFAMPSYARLRRLQASS